LSDVLLEIGEIASVSIGLLMSSMRLMINEDQVVQSDDAQRARQIQASYLPSEHPSSDAFEVFGTNRSSPLVGGDYFDYFRRDGSVQCVLADACGHCRVVAHR
jgi:serine phosphatase RsbU (regulator of sigma subunit)